MFPDRESIWSVRQEDRHKFSVYFTILFVIGVAFILWYEIAHVTDDDIFDTIIAIATDTIVVIGFSVGVTFARFEGGDSVGVALENYRRIKYEEGREQGIKEGREQGIEQGREQGIEQGREQAIAELTPGIEALKRRVAELESRNGTSDDDNSGSHQGGEE